MFQRRVAIVLSIIVLGFTSCIEDNDNLSLTPNNINLEQGADFYPIEEAPILFEYDQVSEEVIAAQFEALAEKISNFEKQPESMSELLLMLSSNNSKLGFQGLNLDVVMASYAQGLADIDNPGDGPLGIHLDAIFDIVGSSTFSPELKYKKLQEYKSEFINSTHRGLSSDEANALLYEINLMAHLIKSLSLDPIGSKTLSKATLEVIKVILTVLDINFGTIEDIFTEGGTCATAILSLASSIISCGTVFLGNPFGGFSCILIPIKINKVKKKCDESNIVWTCAMSPDPCCGVNCIAGYKCAYPQGVCVPDHENDPCQNCDEDQVCLNGRCVNM